MLRWIKSLPPAAADKCLIQLERLRAMGHELRRPAADYLENGVYELRARHGRVNYRMLYFFHGQLVIAVSHGFAKPDARVPRQEIERALQRRWRFSSDPQRYSHAMRG